MSAFAFDFIDRELVKLRESGLYRSLPLIEGAQSPKVHINGKPILLLCSNNYLGLAERPELKAAAVQAVEKYGAGAGASRLVSGNMEPHHVLEQRLAEFKGAEAALLFNSGYHANIGVIPALAGRGDVIFSDKLNHASIVDACVLSRAEVRRYPHCDPDALEFFLKRASKGDDRKLIVTDSVFSMDGDIAPLRALSELAERYGCMLMIDDAHAAGVLGRNGRGALEHLNMDNPNIIQMGTLGKAMGCFGAYVSGSRSLIEYLINKARSFIYTTALPPSVCAAAVSAIDIIENEPQLRTELWQRVDYFRNGLTEAGFDIMNSSTQIIPVKIGDTSAALNVSKALLEKGVFAQAIRPPTVPDGTSRLRITLMANHEWSDLNYALQCVKETAAACQ